MAALLRLRLTPRARRSAVLLCLAAGVAMLAVGMATGNGVLIMAGLLLAGVANVWRTWGNRPAPIERDDLLGGAMQLERTVLPGIGTSFRFPTRAGASVGVIRHLDGRRELVVYAVSDPDTVRAVLTLTPAEAHELAEILAPHHHPDASDDAV